MENRREFFQSLIFATVFVLVFNFFFRIVIIRGPSMEPTLYDGNVRIVSKLSKAEKEDIIVFWQEDEYMIKRVIATEGDKVESRNNRIYVNGKDRGAGECEDFVVPIGEYFVLGDNRDNSYDSREFGCIKEYMGVVQ